MTSLAPSIIITRAEPGASETARRVTALGARAVSSPVLRLRPLEQTPVSAPETLSGLVFTSANGVRAYADRTLERHLPAWCVGPATAGAAKACGFETIHESSGNAVDLANFITDRSRPGIRPLLHVANAAAKGDLKRALNQNGFAVEFAPLYEMQRALALSPSTRSLIAAKQPAIVLIHSAKGADSFATLCADLPTDNLVGVAISEPASQPLAALQLTSVHIAPEPNEDGLFIALGSAIATLSA